MTSDDVHRLKSEISNMKKKLQELEVQLQVYEKLDNNAICFSLKPEDMCKNCICWKMLRSKF